MAEVAFQVSDFLSKKVCPECKGLFLVAYGSYEFFEGVFSTCPNCKTVYLNGKGCGLQQFSLAPGANPENFLWTEHRCEEFKFIISDYYGSRGYQREYDKHGNIVEALRYMNKALAIRPTDERHAGAINEILESDKLRPEWIEFEINHRRINPKQKGNQVRLSYHIGEADRNLSYCDGRNKLSSEVRHKHMAIDHLVFAMRDELTHPGLYEKVRTVFLGLLDDYKELHGVG